LNFFKLATLYIFFFPDLSFGSSISINSGPTNSLKSFPVKHTYYLDLSLTSYSLIIPAFFEIAVAVSILSPVHMITVIPASWQSLIESLIESLRGSSIPNIAMATKSYSRTAWSFSSSKLL